MSDDILATLNLIPADMPSLPASARNSLIAYFLRWEHHDAADRCLQQLLVTHSHLVSVYDAFTRLYLARNQPTPALEMIRRRHVHRVSNSSRALEARVHLAAGDLPSARAIADQLVRNHPDLLLGWRLLADVQLEAGDLDGAEDACRHCETLRPGVAPTALGLARIWQARRDHDQALLWARTALAQTERDQRPPSVHLLRLLESLYGATGQGAQARATADRIRRRQKKEFEELRRALDAAQPSVESKPIGQPAGQPVSPPLPIPDKPTEVTFSTQSLTGALDLTPDERTRLDGDLNHHFGHEAFRPGQADVVAAILRGQSVLTVMPTGAGKSLCYQLAAMLLPGTTLVISPLIALMKDQLDGLPTRVAAQATTLNSTLSFTELRTRLARAASGGYKLLYAAPERLRQRPFLHALERSGVSLLVVDEAHCVSLWGHDFRPDYLFIAKAWQELDQPPILAMTATATPRVRDDIQVALGRSRFVATDIQRSNLYLEARSFAKNAEKQQALLDLCRQLEGSGIIYAPSRRRCEELAETLRRSGISAIHYHAGIEDRAAAQDRFMCDQARIIVATIAFGMGVDKADVRFIIHYSPPKSLENYYQEAGRAGRDGLPAHCILFHTPHDKGQLTRFSRQDALHVDFLRRAYAAIRRRLGSESVGLLAVGDLERDLVADETQLRVAIHFLETSGLLWRGFDLPRTASLTLRRAPDGEDPVFDRFLEAARLRIGQPVSRSLVALSHDAGLDPRVVERRLLTWHDTGWLRYRGIGRDMLLALPAPPPDSEERVAAMLAEYHAGQDGRIAEMMAYATTRRCRHGHISAYFGGRPIEHCQACDNCLRPAAAHPRPAHRTRPSRRPRPVSSRVTTDNLTPNEVDSLTTIILQGVANLPFPMGRTGLVRALQGALSSTVQGDRFPLFGVLAAWTQKSIRAHVARLEEQGLLVPFKKGGYRLLHLSAAGQDWLTAQPQDLATPTAPQPRSLTENPVGYDEDLYQRLRAWRLERARKLSVPPYVIFHDKAMKHIALSRPTSLEELADIKGIGPRLLEQHGSAVLDIVTNYVENSSQ